MASFSGSYRAQMQSANELKAATADFTDAMKTTQENLSWTDEFLADVNATKGSLLDELGEYGSMLDAEFTPAVADALEMGGGEATVAALAEGAADAVALALGAEIAIPVGAVALAYFFGNYAVGTSAGHTPSNYTRFSCGTGYDTQPLLGYQNGWSCSDQWFYFNTPPNTYWPQTNGAVGTGVYVTEWRHPVTPGTWGIAVARWYPNGGGTADKSLFSAGGSQSLSFGGMWNPGSVKFGDMSAPSSVSDPLTNAGDGDDPDHPRNKRDRWRPGPQDWPNIPRHFPGPKVPDQPPPGGTSGGGGSSGGFDPEPPPLPKVIRPWESGQPPYKVPAHSYSNSNDQWEMENDWHMLVPDYAIKILMQHGIYEKTHWFKSPKGLDDLFKILAKSIPNHPCVGLTGSARVECVMQNIDRVSWKHFAGQVGREASKVDEPGIVRTPLPNWDRRAKKAFQVVRAVHNSVALGVKRSRVFSNRKGMF